MRCGTAAAAAAAGIPRPGQARNGNPVPWAPRLDGVEYKRGLAARVAGRGGISARTNVR